MLKTVKHVVRSLPRRLGPRSFAPQKFVEKACSVLAVGIGLAERENCMQHIQFVLGQSRHHTVTQSWIVLDSAHTCVVRLRDRVSEEVINKLEPRSLLINRILARHELQNFDYVMLVDDDICLPTHFVDHYLANVRHLGFSLSQPARTANSYISHPITRRVRGLLGRQTRFVEIGPLVCIAKPLFASLLPLDKESPMGFGLDSVWPVLVEEQGLSMGIIDAVPVDHSIRRPGSSYISEELEHSMAIYFSTRRHLSYDLAMTTVKSFRADGLALDVCSPNNDKRATIS